MPTLDKVEIGGTFTPIPPGVHLMEVKSAQAKMSAGQATRGADTIEMTLKADGHDTTIYDTLTFHPKTKWRIGNFLLSTGFKVDGKPVTAGQDNINLEAADVVGLRGYAEIITDDYNGKKRSKVGSWLVPKTTTTDDENPFK